MRAVITGATGFVGSYLARILVEHKHSVAVVVRPESNTWRIRDILPNVVQINGDIQDISQIRSIVADFAPDTFFHLAWYGVGNKQHNERKQVDINLNCSINVVDLAVEVGCKSFIGLGSQAEYGPRNAVIDENELTEPVTHYGAAKLATYHISKRIAEDAGLRFAWIRLFSAYGPTDRENLMIPYLINALLRKERPSLTAGEQRWDYLYVEDAAEAIYEVGKCTKSDGVFNLGSGTSLPLKNIIEMIRDFIDPSLPLGFGEVPYRADQVMHLEADISKLRNVVGWQPKTSLAEGLRKTVEYHKHEAGLT